MNLGKRPSRIGFGSAPLHGAESTVPEYPVGAQQRQLPPQHDRAGILDAPRFVPHRRPFPKTAFRADLSGNLAKIPEPRKQ